jgi:hypothetical protein
VTISGHIIYLFCCRSTLCASFTDIYQRYTYSAIQDVTFSRDDKNLKGKDGETKSYRQNLLLKKAMKVVHHASLSRAGHDRALEMMDELLLLQSRLEPDIEGDDSTNAGEGIQVFVVLF